MGMAILSRKKLRAKRHQRIRRKIQGTPSVPRMSVSVSGKHLYVQFIDDVGGNTLASASTIDKKLRSEKVSSNCQGAEVIGKIAAERAIAIGIEAVVFDRCGFKFHGRVKAIADSARKTGLKF